MIAMPIPCPGEAFGSCSTSFNSYVLSAQCSLTLTGCVINVLFKDHYLLSTPFIDTSVYIHHITHLKEVSAVKSVSIICLQA